MTENPPNLLAVRSLLLDTLGPYGLTPVKVGIKGDTSHIQEGNSYHLGKPEQETRGYAYGESPLDSGYLTRYASALDIGTFTYKQHNLRTFSRWLVSQCSNKTPDTQWIREVIYSPDGVTVRRWDRLGKRNTGPLSHLEHTHISYFRKATANGYNLAPLFTRYLTTIGLLDMLDDDDIKKIHDMPIGNTGLSLGVHLDRTYDWAQGAYVKADTIEKRLDALTQPTVSLPADFMDQVAAIVRTEVRNVLGSLDN